MTTQSLLRSCNRLDLTRTDILPLGLRVAPGALCYSKSASRAGHDARPRTATAPSPCFRKFGEVARQQIDVTVREAWMRDFREKINGV